jgi:hypothetical protein
VRISSVEIKNYRAFAGLPIKVNLGSAGKNLLVYGENGSGKSSLFFALKDFFECAGKGSDITQFPFRNIFVDTDNGYVKVLFADPNAARRNPNPQAKLYEWSAGKNETGEQLILEVNKTKGFIDYKALLLTYFLQQESATVNIFDLLISSILSHAENDLSRRSFGEEWRDINNSLTTLNRRSSRQRETLIDKIKLFNDGLRTKLDGLKDEAQKLLNYFGYTLEIELNFGGVEYNADEGSIDKKIAGLKVKFFKETRDDHHRFLNEAKLSAIAISIFFAALLLQPPSRLRVLALDDVLIGLDMTNRLPVLDILDKHFGDYQIFFFTYDKVWYEIVKAHIAARNAAGNWAYIEFFAGKTDDRDVPIFAPERKFLDAAKAHLKDNDYKAAAVYARTHLEAKLKRFCDKKALKVRFREKLNEYKSDDFWKAINDARAPRQWEAALPDALIQEVERYRSVILNPLSHADWRNVHRAEVAQAIDVLEKLEGALDATV